MDPEGTSRRYAPISRLLEHRLSVELQVMALMREDVAIMKGLWMFEDERIQVKEIAQ